MKTRNIYRWWWCWWWVVRRCGIKFHIHNGWRMKAIDREMFIWWWFLWLYNWKELWWREHRFSFFLAMPCFLLHPLPVTFPSAVRLTVVSVSSSLCLPFRHFTIISCECKVRGMECKSMEILSGCWWFFCGSAFSHL